MNIKKGLICALALVAFACTGSLVQAQVQPQLTPDQQAKVKEMQDKALEMSKSPSAQNQSAQQTVIVATVEIANARVISKDGNAFTIAFDISNKKNVQPEVLYAVSLSSQDKDGKITTADRQIFRDDVLTIGENKTFHKEIRYVAPGYVKGEYSLILEAVNKSGLMLAGIPFSKESFSGTDEYVEIVSSSCKSKQEKKSNPNIPSVSGAVLADPGEQVSFECQLTNHGSSEIAVIPSVEAYANSIFSDRIAQTKGEQISIPAGKTVSYDFKIPSQQKPQHYEVSLSLLGQDGAVIAPSILAQYFVNGLGLVIQNALFNKDYFSKGDTATISAVPGISGGIPSQEDENKMSSAKITLDIKNKEGQACGQQTSKNLADQKTIPIMMDMAIDKDCSNPQADVKIVLGDGSVLAEHTFSVVSQSGGTALPQQSALSAVSSMTTMAKAYAAVKVIAIVLIILALAIGVIFIVKKRRRATMLLLGLCLAGGLFAGVREASASSFCAMGLIGWAPACFASINTGLTKGAYTLGEPVVAYSSVAVNTMFGIVNFAGTNTATGQAITIFSGMYGNGTYWPAPVAYYSSPLGSYAISYGATSVFWWGSSTYFGVGNGADYFSITPANGVCGSDNGKSFTLPAAPANYCSVGNMASLVSTPTGWTWTCTGLGGGANASCGASRNLPIDGACGADSGQVFTLPAAPASYCNPGSVSGLTSTASGWTWTCSGVFGGNPSGPCTASVSAAPAEWKEVAP